MKKLGLIALAATLTAGSFSPAWGAESAAGGIEFSGNVDVVTGWQHDDGSAVDFGSCPLGAAGGTSSLVGPAGPVPGFGTGCNAADTQGAGRGILGDFRGLATPNRDTFNFYLDVVELDVQKTFGENIRIRADLDFGRFLSGSGRNTQAGSNFNLEQGYVTANIPIGNGMEFLVGRFNAPIGLEAVDRVDNIALSYTNIYRYLRPNNLTGVKLYYAFNDWFDWSIYVVNNLQDTFNFGATIDPNTGVVFGGDSAIPSWGTRFGFSWGSENKKSTIGLSYAGGPEMSGNNAHLTNIIDLDFLVHVTDNFRIGGEGIYRQDDVGGLLTTFATAAAIPAPSRNSKAAAGSILFAYAPSEAWDLWFRYGYTHDINGYFIFGGLGAQPFLGTHTGLDQQIHDFTLGTSYQITDGARMKIEYRLDLFEYSNAVATAFTGGDTSSISQGLAAEFGYNF